MLLIETIHGTIKITPIERGKLIKQFTCEFWDERDALEFIREYELSPFSALFAYECIRQRRILMETGMGKL